jgi:hypothetical protein
VCFGRPLASTPGECELPGVCIHPSSKLPSCPKNERWPSDSRGSSNPSGRTDGPSYGPFLDRLYGTLPNLMPLLAILRRPVWIGHEGACGSGRCSRSQVVYPQENAGWFKGAPVRILGFSIGVEYLDSLKGGA